ncbi:MAG: hypothetical protein AAF429_01745 [Pseudomonadota bacterium]
MKRLLVILLITSIGWIGYRMADSEQIAVGQSQSDDPCGAVAVIESNRVQLQRRPSTFSYPSKFLNQGARVSLCDRVGNWHGVILLERGKNCLENTQKKYYDGTCLSGWVHQKHISFFAG